LLISGTLISPARAQQSRAQAAAVVADFQKGLAGAPIARATLATRGLGYYLNTFCPSVYSDTDKCMSIAMDYLKGVPAPEGYDETAILVLELSREICGSAPVQKQNACLIGSINSHINIARNSVSRSEMARVRRSHILEFKKHINRCVVDIAPPR